MRLQKKDGTEFCGNIVCLPIQNENGEISSYRIAVIDINKRKLEESRTLLTSNILELLNNQDDSSTLIHEILQLIKNSTGIQAVGIRLNEGVDYPYYETSGFTDEFVQAERYLCTYDLNGNIIQDKSGNPLMECMCGNVIQCRTDPTLSFFTEGGSFWSNCTTDLLASTTDKERQTHTRNRCNGEGYESVALIPLKSGDSIIGLLQFNDHRKNQFTIEMIKIFEGLGNSIGIAIDRKKAENQIKQDLKEKTVLLQEIYHRTKNNMQVIISMLKMQSRRSDSDYLKTSFKEIVNKINVMSLVHQKLYEAKDLSKINLKDYVDDLVHLLRKSYSLQAANVSLNFELDDVYILIDSAVPLGLALNELISNIFKHAFPNNRKGEISIRLYQEENGTINIQLTDNGIGIPADLDLRKSSSMGLEIMFSLIESQLKGEVTYKIDNGLKWHLKFRDDMNIPRV